MNSYYFVLEEGKLSNWYPYLINVSLENTIFTAPNNYSEILDLN